MGGRCETCKWWSPVTWMQEGVLVTWAQKGIPHGECRKIRSFHPDEEDGIASVPAFIEEDCGGNNLNTRPDFGCVQWEAKDGGIDNELATGNVDTVQQTAEDTTR